MAGGKHIYQDMCLYQCASKRSRSGGGGGGGGSTSIRTCVCISVCVRGPERGWKSEH